MSRTIIFYRTEDGRCPLEEFLDSLQPKEAQKVLWVLRIIEEFKMVPTHYFKNSPIPKSYGNAELRLDPTHIGFSHFFLMAKPWS